MTVSPEYLVTALVVVLIPGTGVLYTVAVGLGQGRWPSVAAALGCTLGIVPHLAASVLGLAALLHASAVLFTGLKYVGAAYLLYLAIMTLRDRGPVRFNAIAERRPALALVRSGVLLNVLNPKLSVFFLAFLPQFVPAGGEHAMAQMLELSSVFMAMTFVVFAVYGVLAAQVRQKVLESRRAMAWLRGVSAAAFGALGARLALSNG
ncbi:MAG: LysE family translocator [Nitratireductor sp.]|nr:LysE family translocator [Nitratireductor sp.]